MLKTLPHRTLTSLGNHSHEHIIGSSKLLSCNVCNDRLPGQFEQKGIIEISEDSSSTLADSYTYYTVLQDCIATKSLADGKIVHSHMIKTGHNQDVFAQNSLINMYAKCGSLVAACQVFDKMSERSAFSWAAMTAAYVQTRHFEEALKLFSAMQRFDIKPNEYVFSSVLKACSSVEALEVGNQFFAYIVKIGCQSSSFVGNALIDLYGKSGRFKNARRLFDKMANRNLVSWNSMITGYARGGLYEEALGFFGYMKKEELDWDCTTVATVVGVCANLEAFELGYAHHGFGKEAIQLFEQMRQSNVAPNHITFVSVLSACSREGLVSEGSFYFNSMTDHGIEPQMEHYACMIGLLGRCADLDKAEELIEHMPFEPDFVAWRTLLGVCRDQGNIRLGKYAANCIWETNPEDPGTYVLLSNMYAEAGRWDQAADVRKLMKNRGVRKEPGVSWIEVKNRVHVFSVGDRKHPQTKEIFAKLKELTEQMKKEGYTPDMSSMLLDLEH